MIINTENHDFQGWAFTNPGLRLVNKRTKFTVVYVRLQPEFRSRVHLPVRLLQNVRFCLPEVHLPNTQVKARLPKVYFH